MKEPREYFFEDACKICGAPSNALGHSQDPYGICVSCKDELSSSKIISRGKHDKKRQNESKSENSFTSGKEWN